MGDQPARPGFERPPVSMVMTRIGGHDYPLQSEPHCKTCQSPHRVVIEHLLITGRTPAGIAKELEKFEDEGHLGHPNKENIRNHYRQGHMPLDHAMQRELIDRRAEETGRDYENEVENLIDQHTVATRVMLTGFESIVNGEIAPSVTETLAAAKLVQDIESKSEANADQEAMMSAMLLIMGEAEKLFTRDQWQLFLKNLSTNPVLLSLSGRNVKPLEIEHDSSL